MVVSSLNPVSNDKILHPSIPVIDMSWRRDLVLNLMVRACEEFGFFKLINHGVPKGIIANMENEGKEFFSLPIDEKKKAGPPNPLGYGIRNIGRNGDTGELEYLLLHTNPNSISQRARSICKKDPSKFSRSRFLCSNSGVLDEYVDAVKRLACEILDMLGEGLGVKDKWAFSRLLRDKDSDSLIRMNHYPPYHNTAGSKDGKGSNNCRIGFGEHSDPQIISVLRSNDVEGLQILSSSTNGDVWVPVVPDPSAFFVNVGDTLEALTNGRFISVRHRAMANSYTSRYSMIYFGAPPLHEWISPLPEMITPSTPRRYKSFTWAEYKKIMYSLRLSHNRLSLFQMDDDEERTDMISWL
ncbi:gibberellin 2-beta-dioxygenase 2-like [Asparagus officinalis]|uniref:gibberellin 2-beta-dioxygenase 2-like n=1 Tax=Asparagus officinalis TaxID=4686 RepID=UPI00098E6C4F|nr:gibberellin 2-beta-dioxygenase 2-like [Asparagus officinalis]